uniref:Uncharacterized protein n=1 Tax=Oryza punctata TaxID=4537 RepID=A0A0E0JJ98_ORYPU
MATPPSEVGAARDAPSPGRLPRRRRRSEGSGRGGRGGTRAPRRGGAVRNGGGRDGGGDGGGEGTRRAPATSARAAPPRSPWSVAPTLPRDEAGQSWRRIDDDNYLARLSLPCCLACCLRRFTSACSLCGLCSRTESRPHDTSNSKAAAHRKRVSHGGKRSTTAFDLD